MKQRYKDFILGSDIRVALFVHTNIYYSLPNGELVHYSLEIDEAIYNTITFSDREGNLVPAPWDWNGIFEVVSENVVQAYRNKRDNQIAFDLAVIRSTCAYAIAIMVYKAHSVINETQIRKRAKELIHKSLQEALPRISKGEEFQLHPYTLSCEDAARDEIRKVYHTIKQQTDNPSDAFLINEIRQLHLYSMVSDAVDGLAPYWAEEINKSPLGCFHITSQQGGALRAVNKDEAQVGDSFTANSVHYNLGELIEPNYLDIKKGSEFLDLDSVAFNVDNQTNRSITIAHHTGQVQTIEPGDKEDITLFAFPANYESDVYARLTSDWIA